MTLRSLILSAALAGLASACGATASMTIDQAAQQAPNSPADGLRNAPLGQEAALADLALARQTLESLHPGYSRYTAKPALDDAWREAELAVAAEPTFATLYREISRVSAQIRCDHTKAELPEAFEAARDKSPIYLPFRFKVFDEAIYVVDPGTTPGLTRGDRIISIDGTPAEAALAAVYALFPVDGDTDHIKPASVSDFGEFIGPAFEHFYPFLFDISPTAELQVDGAGGKVFAVTADRLSFEAYRAMTGEARFSANFVDAIRFEPIGETAAYLAVDTFINYRRPVEPDSVYGPVFERLAAEGRDRLILDLRRNGGGSTDAQVALLQWLMPGPFRQADAVLVRTLTVADDVRPHLSSWNEAALNPDPSWFSEREDGFFEIIAPFAGKPPASIAAKPAAFTGELVVLTGPDNASGVTHLLAVLEANDRATFVGAPTGGAATGATAGVLAMLTLPASGIKVRVPLQRTVIANASALDPRGGITPDVLAPATLASTLEGTDPAMAAALRLLSLD